MRTHGSKGAWRRVAADTVNGHRGTNPIRIAGRWNGQLVPARAVQILVQARTGTGTHARWTTPKTVDLTVRSPYTTKILTWRQKALWVQVRQLLAG